MSIILRKLTSNRIAAERERCILISSYEFHETPVMFMHKGVQQMESALGPVRKLLINLSDVLRFQLENSVTEDSVYIGKT